MPLLFIILLFIATAHAQPWQWEQYEGTFWHNPEPPPTLPLGPTRYTTAGDFDGNGRDEIITVYMANYEIWYLNDVGQWDNFGGEQYFSPNVPDAEIMAASAFDFDNDGRDELLVYDSYDFYTIDSAYCWKLDPDSEWVWISCDEILDSLAFPYINNYSVFGDFDGDGLLNAVTEHILDWGEVSLVSYERSEDGSWVTDFEIYNWSDWPIDMWVSADLDFDGDRDFGYVRPGIDCDCYDGVYFENLANGSVGIESIYPVVFYAGDFDGDGETEGITESGMYVQFDTTSVFVDPIVPQNYLTPNTSYIEQGSGGTIYGFYNTTVFDINWHTPAHASKLLRWTPTEWITLSFSGGGHIFEGNTADVNGDGVSDVFRREQIGLVGGQFEAIRWYTNLTDDYFSFARFDQNEDTTFVNPRIGDVEGDGHGELVTKITSGAPTGLYFYEMTLTGNQISFQDRPDLSTGLPTNSSEFTLGDIDNDGQAELLLRNETTWQAYFRRNGHWVSYPGILPNGIGNNLNVVDFDNDGNRDLNSSNGVWLNMTPSATNDPPHSIVADLSLSCYPNPFNPETRISFELPVSADIRLDIFDIQGRLVSTLVNENLSAGSHSATFNGVNLSTGVYFARLSAGANVKTTKLLLLK